MGGGESGGGGSRRVVGNDVVGVDEVEGGEGAGRGDVRDQGNEASGVCLCPDSQSIGEDVWASASSSKPLSRTPLAEDGGEVTSGAMDQKYPFLWFNFYFAGPILLGWRTMWSSEGRKLSWNEMTERWRQWRQCQVSDEGETRSTKE